jgi:hypothetical protein
MSNYHRFLALLFFLFSIGCQPMLPAADVIIPIGTPRSDQTPTLSVATSTLPASPSPTITLSPPEPELASESLLHIEPLEESSFFIQGRIAAWEDEIGWNTITVAEGRVWLGTSNSSIEILDSETGERLDLIRLLIPGKSQFGGSVLDLVYDGRYMWAALSRMDDLSGSLMVIDPNDNAVISMHLFPTGWKPQTLAVTPGLIWVAGRDFYQPFEAGTLQPYSNPIRLSTHMVEDEIHSIVYPGGDHLLLSARFSSAYINLLDPLFKPHYAAVIGHRALFDGQSIWTTTFGKLERFSSDLETFPDLKLDLARLWGDPQAYTIALTSDLDNLWILEARGPYLYKHDLSTGKYLDKFLVLDPEDVRQGNSGLELVKDGNTLWVLASQELVKVALP